MTLIPGAIAWLALASQAPAIIDLKPLPSALTPTAL